MFHVEHSAELSSLLLESATAIGVSLKAEQINSFLIYLDELKRWNQKINLTSITKDREIIVKHFVDSLAGLRTIQFPDRASVLDVGTGAGFPGIPLKIVRSDLAVTLIEPNHKKASFLHFIVGAFKLDRIKIFEGTLKKFLEDQSAGELFDIVTTRALKPDELLEAAPRLLKKDGKIILYLSEKLSRANVSTKLDLLHEHSFELPKTFGKRVVSVLGMTRRLT